MGRNMAFDQKLDQHQHRREQGIPTLSVLIGSSAHGTALWRAWALARGRSWLRVEPEAPAVVQDAARAWLAQTWILKRLVDYAAPHLELPPRRILDVLQGAPGQERAHVIERMLSVVSSPSVERLCRHVLVDGRDGETTPLDAGSARRLVQGLARVEGVQAPGLLFLDFEAVEKTAAALADLAERCPGVPIGWAIPAAAFQKGIESRPGSRARTLCLEGLVFVDGACGMDLRQGAGSGVETETEDITGAENAQRAEEEVVDGPADRDPSTLAPEERAGQQGWEDAEEARSAAEAFLFQRLESLPQTAGLFELNGTLAAPWGPHGRAEVDLLCRSRGLAVEIDGYHHFCSPDGYRRDRQKDVLLQQQGFLVLRFLAEDVVSGLETILDTILTSLRWREDHST